MKKRKVWIFGLFLLYLLVILWVLPMSYAINDDTAMRDIASGALSGTPDWHLIFVKAIWGLLLVGLYHLASGIDWYGCLFVGILLISSFLLLERWDSLWERKGKGIFLPLILWLGGFSCILLEHLVNFQFTVVAAVAVGTAIFLYGTQDGKKRYTEVVCVLLIWISFCVRTDVLLMAVPFGGLIFLSGSQTIRRKAITGTVALAGLAGILIFEHMAYKDVSWQNYLSYNDERSLVYDYYGVPSYEEHGDFYQSIGMGEADTANLERYNLYFIDGLEHEKMPQIAAYAKEQYEKTHSFSERLKAGIKTALKGELDPGNRILNLLTKGILLWNLLYAWKKKKKSGWLSLGFLGCEGVLMLYLGVEGRLPTRVGTAMFFIELCAAGAVLCREQMEKEAMAECRYSGWIWVMAAVAIMVTAGSQFDKIQTVQQKAYDSSQQYEVLEQYFSQHSDKVYFMPVEFAGGYTEEFRLQREGKPGNSFELGGWLSFSPVCQAGLSRCGIDGNPAEAIREQENVYLILSAPSSKIESYYQKKQESIEWIQEDTAPIFYTEVPVFKIKGGESI